MAGILEQFSLSDRNFVVTGASSGIGRAMAGFLAQAGARVVLVARREDALAEAVASLGVEPDQASYLSADLSDRSAIGEIAAACKSRFASGAVDGVVNAAGLNLREPVDQISLESWDLTVNLNLAVPFFFTREFVPEMRERGSGTIVNVSSFATRLVPPHETLYAASKFAMNGFTEGLWNDLAGSNIHAALVIPGPIDTEIWDKDDTPSAYDGAKHPPKIVTRAIFEAIEKRRHEIVVPKRSPQLMAARVLKTCFPRLLRYGMARMEPVPDEVIEGARARARSQTGR